MYGTPTCLWQPLDLDPDPDPERLMALCIIQAISQLPLPDPRSGRSDMLPLLFRRSRERVGGDIPPGPPGGAQDVRVHRLQLQACLHQCRRGGHGPGALDVALVERAGAMSYEYGYLPLSWKCLTLPCPECPALAYLSLCSNLLHGRIHSAMYLRLLITIIDTWL